MLTQEQQQRVQHWLHVKAHAAQLAAQEREMRDALVAELFAGKGDGTHRVEVAPGYSLKLAMSTTISVEQGDKLNQAVQACRGMQGWEKLPEALFSWKPSLVAKEWKELPKAVQQVFYPALTSKPAAPQLELESPKVKK